MGQGRHPTGPGVTEPAAGRPRLAIAHSACACGPPRHGRFPLQLAPNRRAQRRRVAHRQSSKLLRRTVSTDRHPNRRSGATVSCVPARAPVLVRVLTMSTTTSALDEPDSLSRRPLSLLLLFARGGATPHSRPVTGRRRDVLIEPHIELARNYQLSAQGLSRVLQLVVDHEQEIRDACQRHFGR